MVMTKNRSFLAAGVITLGLASAPALATSSRTFVSGESAGGDAGTCGVTAPCRTFAYALTQTAPSGEIIVLTSAGYGAVTINQAVSIINTSNFAGVAVASGDGITINAGVNDSVTLRGLTIDGGGTGSNGIVFNTGGKLTIDQCDVINFVGSNTTGNGILMQPTSGNHNIVITNTTASNNQHNGVFHLPPSGSTATSGIVLDHVTANNNGTSGFVINNFNSSGAATASISNSIASFNTSAGFFFGKITASLDASYASSNSSYGVFVGPVATLVLGRSVLMFNAGYGLDNSGTVSSYQDNRIAGNTLGQVLTTPAPASLY
jgi:hypothetical protein